MNYSVNQVSITAVAQTTSPVKSDQDYVNKYQ